MANKKLFISLTLCLFTSLFARVGENTIKNKEIKDIDLYNYRQTAIVQFPSKILKISSENFNFTPETIKFTNKYLLIGSRAKLSNQLFYILTEKKAYYYYISTSYNEAHPIILEIEE